MQGRGGLRCTGTLGAAPAWQDMPRSLQPQAHGGLEFWHRAPSISSLLGFLAKIHAGSQCTHKSINANGANTNTTTKRLFILSRGKDALQLSSCSSTTLGLPEQYEVSKLNSSLAFHAQILVLQCSLCFFLKKPPSLLLSACGRD